MQWNRTLRQRLRAALLAVAGLLGSASLASAQAVNLNQSGVAIDGYDPVSYFAESQAQKGLPDIAATYQGGTYYFATTTHRDAFNAEPGRYLPAYGGYCAYGVAHGHKVKVDPEAFKVVDGRLYLNYSKDVQVRWFKDIPGFIAAAERNWVGLKDAPRD